jgi:hypothetical protein
MTAPSRLRGGATAGRQEQVRPGFDVASQDLAAGSKDAFVRAITPLSCPVRGQRGIGVGRLPVYSPREALGS